MGAWGVGIFENDDACDFAAAVAESHDLSLLEATLDRVIDTGEEYLEAPQASEALAAADIIARLKKVPRERTSYTASIDKWIDRANLSPSDQLVDKARRAIARVLTEPSELLELWQESDEFESWRSSVGEVASHLS
jgi:hypothetical protein